MTCSLEIKLADIAANFARLDKDYKYFHSKLFSFIVPDLAQFQEMVSNLHLVRESFPNQNPATLVLGKLSPLVPLQTEAILGVADNQLKVVFVTRDAKLPDINYLAIISPVGITKTGFSYVDTFGSISVLRSIISLTFGGIASYQWVADFDFDLEGRIHLPSEVARLPVHADFFRVLNKDLLTEVSRRLAHQLPEFRQKFQTACNFFNLALNQRDEQFRFTAYWIALEILIGKSGAIRAKLCEAYQQKDVAFADQTLLFREISRVRNDLVHKGRFTSMPAYHERLLQLYFWDIVIDQVGLKPRQLSLMFVQSGLIENERGAPASG